MFDGPIVCHRCGKKLHPERVDLDGWLVLDARNDAFVVAVCRDCQRPEERERVADVSRLRPPPD